MNWKQLLERQLDDAFRVAERLVRLLDEKDLAWKPSEGSNWMTTGQLLLHLGKSCGVPMKGFATGEWDMPGHSDVNEKKTEKKMPPPADQLKSIRSVDEALKLLSLDKSLALETLSKCSEEDLESKPAPAPWDPENVNLGLRLLQMIDHLNQHKAQLFYYLKMQGKPVNTYHLYGK
ncbi:MAG: DinB family protein [Chlorobi bacterium]|nr:DinB family protein [Chlorobiota bacterium]